MMATDDTERIARGNEILDRIEARMRAGDADRGYHQLQRLVHLAMTTDDQQLFAFQSLHLLPQDARDLFAYFAACGIGVSAEET